MSLRIKKSPSQRHLEEVLREPNKKIFIVCEGDKTEVRYFEGIKEHSKELGINDLIELVIMDKNLEFKGTSDPYGLISLANDTIKKFQCNQDGNYEEDGIYDTERDKFLIILDRDKEDFLNYKGFIDEFKDELLLGITNPCFELWLLLHIENSVENIINPTYQEILENIKISNNHTFTSNIISQQFHMNPKKGMRFTKFKNNVLYAIEQEKKLEQDLYSLENKVGSNIGKIIEEEML